MNIVVLFEDGSPPYSSGVLGGRWTSQSPSARKTSAPTISGPRLSGPSGKNTQPLHNAMKCPAANPSTFTKYYWKG